MKKLFLALSAFFLLVFLAWPPVVKADIYSFQQELKNCGQGNSFSLECWIAGADQLNQNGPSGVITALTHGLTTLIVGNISSLNEDAHYVPGGAIGGITNLIAAVYANPPASSVEYLADLGRNLGIVKPAYAQTGVGFQGLRPILPLWKAFRNIAYLFFTIIFVVIGFAIMFRVKLNPQTVISIQNAIPRIVLALILVTFSYAIAGLLIDLSYIITAIVIGALDTSLYVGPLRGLSQKIGDFLTTKGIAGFNPENPSLFAFLSIFLHQGSYYALRISEIVSIPALIADYVLHAPDWLVDLITPLGGISSLLQLILSVVVLFVFFKLLFSLIKAYISIILQIIFAPLQIMLGALPTGGGFGNWLRNTLANIAVFPALIIMMGLTAKIINTVEQSGQELWTPSVLTVWGAGASSRIVVAIIGFGMLLITPRVVDMVREALQVKPFPYGGAAIGEAMGPVKAGVKMVFYTAAGEVVGPGGFLERAGKGTLAMAGRKILGMK